MKYTEAKTGRVFILRLEDGEIVHKQIEKFAKEKGIQAAIVNVVGGADKDSILVVGPKESRAEKIEKMEHILEDMHEITGMGTIIPDINNSPVLHMHISCGRKDKAVTGCIRRGVKVWHVLEVVIQELIECSAKRLMDDVTGFELLNC